MRSPRINGFRLYKAVMMCESPRMHGELTVTGFSSAEVAHEMSTAMAKSIQETFPGTRVMVSVGLDQTYLSCGDTNGEV